MGTLDRMTPGTTVHQPECLRGTSQKLALAMLVCVGVLLLGISGMTAPGGASQPSQEQWSVWGWKATSMTADAPTAQVRLDSFEWQQGREFRYRLSVRNTGQQPFMYSRFLLSKTFMEQVRLWKVHDCRYYRLVLSNPPGHVTVSLQNIQTLRPNEEAEIEGGGSLARHDTLPLPYHTLVECRTDQPGRGSERLASALPQGTYGVQGACLVLCFPPCTADQEQESAGSIGLVFANIFWLEVHANIPATLTTSVSNEPGHAGQQ